MREPGTPVRYTVVITGASGAAYGLRLIERLVRVSEVTAVFTPEGLETAEAELGLSLSPHDPQGALVRFLDLQPDAEVRVVIGTRSEDEAAATEPAEAVIVAPASMAYVGALASGRASAAAHYAADRALRERRCLVLVPTQTPISLIGLRNLTCLAEAGAVILPAVPGYSRRPGSVDDLVNDVVGRILDALDVDNDLLARWR